MAISQSTRFCSFDTPLGPDALLLRRMRMTEGVSQLFLAELQVESEGLDHDPHDIVGKPSCVHLRDAEGNARYFHGIVTRFDQGGRDTRVAYYRVELRPWLWLLTRRSDCRIFQNKSVPDILTEVFQKAGCKDFEKQLQGSFPTRVFCVQYRETDFAFVARLCEEEGIFWYWKHEAGRHLLVLTNVTANLPDCPGQASVDYHSAEGGVTGRDTIYALESGQELHSGKFTLKDFNFEDPANPLQVAAPTADSIGGNSGLELYDYHIEDYGNSGDGNRLVRLRIQAQETAGVQVQGASNCRAFTTGHRFQLEKHFRSSLNGKQYMLTTIQHQLVQPSALHTDDSTEGGYSNTFTCVPVALTFRPPQVTQKPMVHGPQTAMVVGPAGEEIYVDKYGRIKVQFHWDRLGRKDENSSCWVRVSRSWASKQWGQVAHPRIGDEVIVEFLEGDPDKPIVTGCVYNAATMPPYDLPANKTQAGVKSRSSPGGAAANFNEIRFEDKKGSEEFHIQAEKDKTVLVKNNRSENVGNDETISIGHDRKETVGHDETISIGNDRTETVGKNETISIGVDRTETVGSNETITIGSNRTESVGANESVTIAANKTVSVGANHSESIGSNQTINIGVMKTENVGAVSAENVGAAKTVSVGAAYALTVGAAMNVAVGGIAAEEVGKDKTVQVAGEAKTKAKKIVLEADDEIEIKTGAAKIVLKKSGDVSVEGTKIEIKGAAMVDVKGGIIKLNS